MPKLSNEWDLLCGAIEADLAAAFTGPLAPIGIFRGVPRVEPEGLPMVAIVPSTITFGDPVGVMQDVVFGVSVLCLWPRPEDPDLVIEQVVMSRLDLLIERLEARRVWPGGGILGFLRSAQLIDNGEQGHIGGSLVMSIRFHKQLGT